MAVFFFMLEEVALLHLILNLDKELFFMNIKAGFYVTNLLVSD